MIAELLLILLVAVALTFVVVTIATEIIKHDRKDDE